jgi:hypothetical protein
MSAETFLVLSPASAGRPHLNSTGKILLPPMILDHILKSGVDLPIMQFLLENPITHQTVGAGVEQFTADGASCVIPNWMQEVLTLSEHDKVRVSLAKFPLATSAVFQPFTEDFARLDKPRVILEHSLRDIPVLTEDAVVPIEFNGKIYPLKVLKTEPEKVVSIVRADVITEFAQPISRFDHNWGAEEEANETPSMDHFQGPGYRCGGTRGRSFRKSQ